ncbi:MAG: VCBS repeat-containing protein [Planctomycetota bacterium]
MILSVLIVFSGFAVEQFQAPREYVIREIRPPVLKDPRYKFEWFEAQTFGDSDQNGVVDTMIRGQFSPELFSGLTAEGYFAHYSEPYGVPSKKFFDRNNSFGFSTGQWALLKTPWGFQAIVNRVDFSSNAGLNSFNWETGQWLGLVAQPPSFPPPIPDILGARALFPAGDQNGDGYEDFFWSSSSSAGNGYIYYGLYDGATLTVLWQHVEGDGGFEGVPYFAKPGPLPDVDGDGFPDFLISITHLILGVRSHSYVACSGQDGSTIWREDGPQGMLAYIGYGVDLSGDGIPDPVFLEGSSPNTSHRALDGTNGAELWVTSISSLESQYAGDDVFSLTFWRGFQVNQNNLSQAEFVMYHNVRFSGAGGIIAFAHYAASDGTFLGSFPLSTSLAPWSPSPGEFNDARFPMRLGDVDGDGLEEIGIPFFDWERSPGWSVNGSNPNPSTQLAIVGMRTLFVPEVHALSSGNLDFDIAVPAGVNKDFVVVLSTEFDPYGGVEVGPWRLFLDQSPIMNYTMSSQMLSGTLDQNGKGSVSAAIPAHPSLFGKVLYSKALILNPVGSAERILTLSSMGITELQ